MITFGTGVLLSGRLYFCLHLQNTHKGKEGLGLPLRTVEKSNPDHYGVK